MFNDARLEDGNPAYEVILASETGGPIATDTGVMLDSERVDDVMTGMIDTLLITGGAPAQSTAATASLRSCLAKYLDH